MKLGALLAHCAIAIHYHSISDADSMGFGLFSPLSSALHARYGLAMGNYRSG